MRRSLFYFFDFSGRFAPRRPQDLTVPFRGAKSSHKAAAGIAISPANRPDALLPAARKALQLRSGEQNLHIRRRKSPYRRRAGRPLCSPPPARPYGSVPGSKIFTQGGGGNRYIAGEPAEHFAPRRPQGLVSPFLGAKSSHKAAAEIAISPASRPSTLLPAACKVLCLRSWEQNLHIRRRKPQFRRRRKARRRYKKKKGIDMI